MKKRIALLLLSLLTVPSVFAQITVAEKAGIEKKVQDFMKKEDIPAISFAIIDQGKVAFKSSFGVMNRETKQAVSSDTLFQIGSHTKLLTAMITLELVNEGKLTLNDKVIDLLPTQLSREFVNQFKTLTIEHLLIHRSGLPNYLTNVTRIDGDAFQGGFSEEMLLTGLKSAKAEFEPDKKWRYANFNFALLGYVLSKVTNQSYEQLVSQYIAKQYGMKNTFVNLSDSDINQRLATPYRKESRQVATKPWDMGLLAPHGGVYSNIDDLARLMEAHIATYQQYDETENPSPLLSTQITTETGRLGWKWGIGMVEVTPAAGMFSKNVLFHGGDLDGFGCEYMFSPETGLGVVMLTSSGGRIFHSLAVSILKELIDSSAKS